jgi:hypothetical protein
MWVSFKGFILAPSLMGAEAVFRGCVVLQAGALFSGRSGPREDGSMVQIRMATIFAEL